MPVVMLVFVAAVTVRRPVHPQQAREGGCTPVYGPQPLSRGSGDAGRAPRASEGPYSFTGRQKPEQAPRRPERHTNRPRPPHGPHRATKEHLMPGRPRDPNCECLMEYPGARRIWCDHCLTEGPLPGSLADPNPAPLVQCPAPEEQQP